MVNLRELGFDAHFESLWHAELRDSKVGGRRAGRIVQEQKGAYRVLAAPDLASPVSPVWATLAGRLAHASPGAADLPAVGDFVLVEGEGEGRCRLAHLFPRRTRIVRKAAGVESSEQIIAANVDLVFIMTSLNRDLSERRLERYLAAVWDGGALPVVLLSKADLETDRAGLLARVKGVVSGAPILCISATSGEGVDEVRRYFALGRCAALVGSSGVGKSTLINALLGNTVQDVQAIRVEDDKGRHTTTSRTLLMVPGGGMIIDTPGMREFMPSDEGAGVSTVFADVEELALSCRFSNCRHSEEPGCAVREAIDSGQLAEERLASLRKLAREQAYLERKQDAGAASAERKKWKRIHKDMRRHPKKSR